ncbi:MAG TPA: hypothetical protein VHW01_08505, partial [Polyangiaceae bacterium]|nr:hypothetical protein [Polyangiaceae bacterium]
MLSVRAKSFALRVPLAALLLSLAACGAVYPELATPVRAAGTRRLDPPPPDDLVYLKFANAVIPSRTRDGRNW